MRTLISVVLLAALTVCAAPLAAQDKTPKGKETKPVVNDKKAVKKQTAEKKPSEKWTVLFDGKQMKGWKKPDGYDYEDAGKVDVKDGNMVLNGGTFATGIRWTGKFPKTNYEVRLEAQRVDGYDFFVGMSFPVGDQALTLILGGWGGNLTGLSCVDNYRADENETCSSCDFKNKTWYRVRVRVTDKEVTAFVDDEEICKLETENRKLTVTSEMEPCLPFGIATWGDTTGALRNIRYRMLTKQELTVPRK